MTRRKLTGFCALLACCLTASGVVADEIYKRVDADGNIEFSDRPAPDADRIEVQPNVIQTNPVKRRSDKSADAVVTPATNSSAADEDSDTTVTEAAGDPDPGRATRNAVRAISQPRPQPR